MDGQKKKQINGWKEGLQNMKIKQMDGWMDTKIDEQLDGQKKDI